MKLELYMNDPVFHNDDFVVPFSVFLDDKLFESELTSEQFLHMYAVFTKTAEHIIHKTTDDNIFFLKDKEGNA